MISEAAASWGMLLALVVVIFFGFPVSFTLLVMPLLVGYLTLGSYTFDLAYLQVIGLMKEEVLAAVPLFIFMGYVVEKSGLMSRLFEALRDLLAPLPGSLFLVVILSATAFAMATGIVGAAVTVLGIMAGPVMIRAKYDARLSAGALAAGGTLGILIPPSVMLIVMGPVLGISVAELYAAAFGPGFLLSLLYVVYTLGRCWLDPTLGPAVPRSAREISRSKIINELMRSVIPMALLVSFTLGSILAGIATPTEAAGVGALGALILALLNRQCSFSMIHDSCVKTMITSSMVLFLAMASNIFGAVFSRLGGTGQLNSLLQSLSFSPTITLIVVLLLIFILGWPFEWPVIVLVFLPMLQPTLMTLKMEPVLVGILIAVTLQTAYLSPPVAMSAYYLKQVISEWSLGTIYRGMVDFMLIQCLAVALIIIFPGIATWLPAYLLRQTEHHILQPIIEPGYIDPLEANDFL